MFYSAHGFGSSLKYGSAIANSDVILLLGSITKKFDSCKDYTTFIITDD